MPILFDRFSFNIVFVYSNVHTWLASSHLAAGLKRKIKSLLTFSPCLVSTSFLWYSAYIHRRENSYPALFLGIKPVTFTSNYQFLRLKRRWSILQQPAIRYWPCSNQPLIAWMPGANFALLEILLQYLKNHTFPFKGLIPNYF